MHQLPFTTVLTDPGQTITAYFGGKTTNLVEERLHFPGAKQRAVASGKKIERSPSLGQGVALREVGSQINNADERECLATLDHSREGGGCSAAKVVLSFAADAELPARAHRHGFAWRKKRL